MTDYLEEFLVSHEYSVQEKTSEEVFKDFIRAIIYKEVEFEFGTKKEISIMKKVHRKNLQQAKAQPKKKVKTN
jgi:hypothetical protein